MMDPNLFIPNELIGSVMSPNGITTNAPRKWTNGEIEWAVKLQSMGIPTREIASYLKRPDHVQVSIKLKRIAKKNDTYNPAHRSDKESCNLKFINKLKPESVLDLYSGKVSWYSGKVGSIVSNDINGSEGITYKMDAMKCACMLFSQDMKFDIVDLDPFGSAYDCFDIAIKMATKGLCITFGELGHKRFKRLDFVSRHYNITRIEDFTIDNLVKHVQVIGQRNKKNLSVSNVREWRNIGRVWFEIDGRYSIKEQWSK